MMPEGQQTLGKYCLEGRRKRRKEGKEEEEGKKGIWGVIYSTLSAGH